MARLVALTAVGVALWVTLLTSIGYALGTSRASITRALGPATYIVAVLCALTVVAVVTGRCGPCTDVARGRGATRNVRPCVPGDTMTKPTVP